jgi:hypothetical protein
MNYYARQSYLDPKIVEHKRDSEDYTVQIITVQVDGEDVGLIVDGHHSLHAARLDSIDPEFVEFNDLCCEADEIVEDFMTGNSDWKVIHEG